MGRCITRLVEGTVGYAKKNKERYASKIEWKCGTLVQYGSRCEVRSKQILSIPYYYGGRWNDDEEDLYFAI